MFLTTILSTKLVAVVGSAVVAVGSFSGVAYASNGAAPGDALYGLDCALEAVGFGDGGLEERIDEACKMSENGDVDEALKHVAEAVQEQEGSDEDGEAAAALLAAADAVLAEGSEQSLEVRTKVAEMLRWMATTEAEEKDFGQGVAERARGISGETDLPHGETDLPHGKGLSQAIAQAGEMLEDGNIVEALAVLAGAMEDEEGLDAKGDAKKGLEEAIEALQASNGGESEQVRALVAEMLQWTLTTEAEGKDYGQGMAERARQIAQAARGQLPPQAGGGVTLPPQADGGGKPADLPPQAR